MSQHTVLDPGSNWVPEHQESFPATAEAFFFGAAAGGSSLAARVWSGAVIFCAAGALRDSQRKLTDMEDAAGAPCGYFGAMAPPRR